MSHGRRLVVEADGGSRGNPGVAGYGALVRDAESGAVLLELARPLGQASNNVAEYSGLIAGLEGAIRIGAAADVEVRMDSKLVVEQMSGRWKIKHEDMRRLALDARAVCRRIEAAGGRVRFVWVPREKNKAADALSNDAMDGRTIDRMPTSGAPPGHATPASEQAPQERATAVHAADRTPAARTAADRIGQMDSGRPASMSPPTRLVLVRHGVTDNTVSGILDGRGGTDPPLNALGQVQARAAARAVADLVGDEAARLVTSSLRRVAQTGAQIAEALDVVPHVDPAWDERAFGQWDGLTLAEIGTRHPARLARMRADPAYGPPGGESRDAVRDRVLAALGRALEPGGTVVVVSSRVPILVVLAHVLGSSAERFWAPATEPASLTSVELWSDGPVSVPFVNRTGHLDGLSG